MIAEIEMRGFVKGLTSTPSVDFLSGTPADFSESQGRDVDPSPRSQDKLEDAAQRPSKHKITCGEAEQATNVYVGVFE